MKRYLLFVLAAMTAGISHANFVGLESEVYSESPEGTVYRVYATFDNPTDELVAIYALETAPMSVSVSTSFFQSALGSALGTAINPAFFDFFPDMEYDSWFTIGSENSDGTSDIQQVGMDVAFAAFEGGSGFTIDSFIGGSFFLIPNVSADAEAGDDLRVLVGQFTTDGVVEMCLNFQWDNAATDTFNEEGICITFPQVATPGCTDPAANNYNPNATEDDGSCEYDDACTSDFEVEASNYSFTPQQLAVAIGSTVSWMNTGGFHNANGDVNTITGDSFGNPEAFYLDPVSGASNGVCIGAHTFNVPGVYSYDCSVGNHAAQGMVATIVVGTGGCMDASATNYNSSADYEDNSCVFGGSLLSGLSYELIASDPLGSGQHTYRLYADFISNDVEITAVYGTDTEPWVLESSASDGFYNDPVGGDFGGTINPIFFSSFPNLEYDSWFTIGSAPGDTDGLNSAFDSNLSALADFNSGGNFVVNTFIGGSIFVVPGANDQGVPVNGRVLLGQFTTSGVVDALVNIQYRNAAQESIYAEGLSITFPDVTMGCTDATACNYDPTAEMNDGSCLMNDDCGVCGGDNTSCADCAGVANGDSTTDECDTCDNDASNDCEQDCAGEWGGSSVLDDCGVCEGGNSSCGGCTDAEACNYNSEALVEDDSCEYPSEFYTCDGCINDEDGDGVCDELEAVGCMNPSAENYDPTAENDNGSCTWGDGLCTGLSYEVVNSNPIGTGQTTYRLYGNFVSNDVEVTAVYGTDSTPWEMTSTASNGFYNDAVGSDFGGSVNPLFFAAFPDLEYDSWFTIGAEPGDADGLNSAFDAALTSMADFNSGGDFIVNTFIGGSIFVVPGANDQGVPVNNRVLIGQFTTSGMVSALVNIQIRDANQESHYAEGLMLDFPLGTLGCTDEYACNFDPEAELDNGSCLQLDLCGECGGDDSTCSGCTDPVACNYDADAIVNDGCVYADQFFDCNGNCVNDTDGDGVCDELEIAGCTDMSACNYDANATDNDGSCLSLDACGICGGDDSSCSGCTDETACNYDSSAIVDDGSCEYSEMYYDCSGECNNDSDADGVCDELEVPGCTDLDADNYSSDATDDDGSCEYLGCTNPVADNYDESANFDDGSCIILGCTNPDADNYNSVATDDDGSCEATGCTYLGADNYDAINTSDDGSCILSGCTESSALNFLPYANNDDGSCVFEECTGESDCPFDANGDGEIGSADLLEFLIAFGQACSDL